MRLAGNYYCDDIPTEIWQAARIVEHYFTEKGYKDWAFLGIQARDFSRPIDPETPAQRVTRLKAELEQAEAELRREEQKTVPF